MLIGSSVRTPGGTIEVAVLIGGEEQPLYRRAWDGKVFVAGTPGEAYTLRVRNLVPGRVEVINSVDGRNTLKDEPGDVHRNTGLVFSAHTTGQFAGWRLNDDEIREFVFGEPEHSIAAQATGDASNVGVIGFAVYRERVTIPSIFLDRESERGFGAESFSLTKGVERLGSLGTGMGGKMIDHVGRTRFERVGDPDILIVGYETEEVLLGLGIIGPPEAKAFPGIGTGYESYATVS